MPVGIEELTNILHMSISPVALISGVGLLLLSMNNRLGRTIDRVRALSEKLQSADEDEVARISLQVWILYKRSKILRLAISLATVSILFASVIAFCLFAMYSFHARLYALVMTLWGLGIASFVVSLILFIHDSTLTLRALKLNVSDLATRFRVTGKGQDIESG